VGVGGGVSLLETHYVEVFFTKVAKKITAATVGTVYSPILAVY